MKKQVFIINGSGGVGKDAFIKMLPICEFDGYTYVEKIKVENYSSVTKVKEIAKLIGWNGEKTEKNRKFLSDLKLLTTEYNDMPLNDMKKHAYSFMNNNDKCHLDRILFLHIREQMEIAKAVEAFKEYNCKTILVKRDSVKHITSNMADENVYNYNYDIVINNNGTLDDLSNKAKCFLDDFLNNEIKNEY